MEYRRYFFENCIICGECNGDSCKHCKSGLVSRQQFLSRYNSDDDYIALSIRYSAALLCMVNPLKFYGL